MGGGIPRSYFPQGPDVPLIIIAQICMLKLKLLLNEVVTTAPDSAVEWLSARYHFLQARALVMLRWHPNETGRERLLTLPSAEPARLRSSIDPKMREAQSVRTDPISRSLSVLRVCSCGRHECGVSQESPTSFLLDLHSFSSPFIRGPRAQPCIVAEAQLLFCHLAVIVASRPLPTHLHTMEKQTLLRVAPAFCAPATSYFNKCAKNG